MQLNDREIAALRRSFLLHYVSSPTFLRFAGAQQPEFLRLSLQTGERLTLPEEKENRLLVLVSGELRGIQGDKLPQKRILPGFVIGALDLFSKQPAQLPEIYAAEPSELLGISESQMETLFEWYPEIMKRYIYFLTGQLQALRRENQVFSAGSLEGRMVQFLTANAQPQPDGTLEFTLEYSYSSLASRLNMSRATMYRVFDDLEKKGVLRREGKTIRLRDAL